MDMIHRVISMITYAGHCGKQVHQAERNEDSSDLDEVTVCDRYSAMSESETESDEFDEEPATEIVRDENLSKDEKVLPVTKATCQMTLNSWLPRKKYPKRFALRTFEQVV